MAATTAEDLIASASPFKLTLDVASESLIAASVIFIRDAREGRTFTPAESKLLSELAYITTALNDAQKHLEENADDEAPGGTPPTANA